MPIGIYPRIKPIPAFLSKFKAGDRCWQWEASAYGPGYGSFKVNRKSTSAHRFSYQLFYGRIPKGLCVLHSCDNRLCVKPTHLRLGTHKENMEDCIKRGRIAWGERQGLSRFSVSQVKAIRHLHGVQKISIYKIAKMYKCSTSALESIVKYKTWKRI